MSESLSSRDFTRREFLGTAAAGAAAWTASGALAGAAQLQSKPNVLFIFDDQHRRDACSIYGSPNVETPHIDRLASEGMRFDNALSTCPLCTPYRGMLYTGRYPTHSGVVLNWVEVNPDQRAIGHVFRDAGYRTGLIGKWHLAAGAKKTSGESIATPADQRRVAKAIAEYRNRNPEPEYVPPGPSRLGFDHWEAYNFHAAFNNYYYYGDTPERLTADGYETDIEFNQAMSFMRKQKETGQPFFLTVSPHPPHPPFGPRFCPAGYLDRVPESLEWAPNVPEEHPHRQNQLGARCYYAMTKNFDDNMGRMLKFLDETGLAENTIVVYTSDHGEMLGSQNRTNKMVPYREAVDVPLVIRWPGHVAAGSSSDALHTPIDHLPTLARLAGLEPPDTADGTDLSRVALGESRSARDVVLMGNYVSHWDYFDTGTNWPEWRGVHTGQYTYARWLTGEELLYDNHDDPYQMRNLASGGQHVPVLRSLRSELKDLLATAHDDFLPGTSYRQWYDAERNLVRTALGPV